MTAGNQSPATRDESERRNVCQSLRDLIQYGGNMDHNDRKNLIWKAISLIETTPSEIARINVEVPGCPNCGFAMGATSGAARSATRLRLPQHVKDFIDDRSDIRDGQDGPLPNDWMTLQQMIEEAGL